MNLTDVRGIRCTDIRKGLFSDERVVNINGRGYFVSCCNIGFDRQREIFYVKPITIEQAEGRYLIRFNADDGCECLFVEESELVLDN